MGWPFLALQPLPIADRLPAAGSSQGRLVGLRQTTDGDFGQLVVVEHDPTQAVVSPWPLRRSLLPAAAQDPAEVAFGFLDNRRADA